MHISRAGERRDPKNDQNGAGKAGISVDSNTSGDSVPKGEKALSIKVLKEAV